MGISERRNPKQRRVERLEGRQPNHWASRSGSRSGDQVQGGRLMLPQAEPMNSNHFRLVQDDGPRYQVPGPYYDSSSNQGLMMQRQPILQGGMQPDQMQLMHMHGHSGNMFPVGMVHPGVMPPLVSLPCMLLLSVECKFSCQVPTGQCWFLGLDHVVNSFSFISSLS